MRQELLTIITLVASATFSYAQGSIDIDTDIQMGVAGTEHVKITDTNFSVHQDAANPLIYGDFGTGNVGIGANNPASQLEVHRSVLPSIAIGSPNAETGGQSRLIFHAGSGSYKNGFLVNYYKDASTDRLGFVDGGASEVLTLTNGGNVGIGTTTPSTTLSVNGSSNVTGNLEVGGSLALTSLSRKLVKASGTNITYSFTIGDSPGIWNVGHVELWIASIGNIEPRKKALYSFTFQIANGTAATNYVGLVSGDSYSTSLAFSGLNGTLTIYIPEGGAAERMVTKVEVMSVTGVTSLY